MESIIKALEWREATKHFDPNKKLTDDQFETLLEVARLSPSSFGLQPWSFISVREPAMRAKLREASWDQPQVTEASHLIVFTAKAQSDAIVDEYIATIASTRGVPAESLAGFSQMIKKSLASKSESERLEWAKHQVYIALGATLIAAAALDIDSCPMEGFDAAQYDEILGLSARGLHAVAALPVGFRRADNGVKKVRFAKEKVVIEK